MCTHVNELSSNCMVFLLKISGNITTCKIVVQKQKQVHMLYLLAAIPQGKEMHADNP